MRMKSRIALGTFLVALLTPATLLAQDCKVRITGKINLKTLIAREPLLLKDQTLVVGRQNEGSYFFIKPDGRLLNYDLGSEPTQGEPAALDDGTVVVASQDGMLHFLDSDGIESRSIMATPGRYLWHLADLGDATLVALANRPGADKPLGSVHFLNLDGSLKTITDLGIDAVWSRPLILPDRTIALKTQTSKVIFLNPDGSLKSQPVFSGSRGGDLLASLEDGTVVSGGDFGDSRRILFLSPADGSVLSELRFGLENQGIGQDILFLNTLKNGNLAVGFVEYTDGYAERLEILARDGTKIGEHRLKNVGFSSEWNISQLSDGSIVSGAGNRIFFLSETGTPLEEIEIPNFINRAPIVMADDTVAIAAIDYTGGTRTNMLYFVKRECGGFARL